MFGQRRQRAKIRLVFMLEIKNPHTNEIYQNAVSFYFDKDDIFLPRINETVSVNGTFGTVTDIIYHYHKAFSPYIELKVKTLFDE